MGEIAKIKFRCSCQQKILIGADKVGHSLTCPACEEATTVPDLSSPSIVEVYCECATALDIQKLQCPACDKRYSPTLKTLQDRVAESLASPPPSGAAISIPENKELVEEMMIKYSCSCGQKLLMPNKKTDEKMPCPQCEKDSKVPDVSDKSVLKVHCRCGAIMISNTNFCLECGMEYFK